MQSTSPPVTKQQIKQACDEYISHAMAVYNLIFNGHHGSARAVVRDSMECADTLLTLLNDEVPE